MPRSGVNGTYTLPPNTDNQQPLTPISSSMFNAAMDDVEQTFNSVQPEAYGGTGADNFADARTNMGLVTAAVGAMDSQRNRVVNGDMAMSQEYADTAGTANGYFGADQFATYRVNSAGTITTQRVASFTPAGSPYRYRVTITAADASLAAGEYLTITQPLEGSNVADFRYGSASAKASVLRFGFKGPAGTYAARLGNSANNRSFVALFTITSGQANTDTVQTIAIPGDTSGTWLTADGVIGIILDIVLACGSTFQGSTGWQSGNILGTSGVSNGMGTGGAVFELFDVGLRLDADATGVYGRYLVGEVDAIFRPERYYRVYGFGRTALYLANGIASSTTACVVTLIYDFEMAGIPSFNYSSFADFQLFDGVSSPVSTSLVGAVVGSRSAGVTVNSTGLVQYRPYILRSNSATAKLSFNARLS